MERRARLSVLLTLAVLPGIMAGCQRSQTREPNPSYDAYSAEVEPVSDTADLASEAKNYRKPSGLSGAWSREGAAIEQSLGVPR